MPLTGVLHSSVHALAAYGYPRTHQTNRARQFDRAVHERHTAISYVRIFQSCLAGTESRRRGIRFGERAGRSRNARQSAALFQLADIPAAVHQRRIDRRLRHHARAVRERRTGAHGQESASLLMSVYGQSATLPPAWAPRPDSLRDRVVLVAGATGGLGRACALASARAGANVVLLGRKVRALEKVYDEIQAIGGAPAIYPLDLAGATPHDYAELAATLEREYGRLDGIVHAAAHFEGLRPAADIAPEEWLRALHVNLTAPFLLTQA